MAIDTEPVAISPGAIPEKVLPIIDARRSPAQRRIIVARAALPMPPEQLVPCLAWLTRDPDEAVRKQARASLESLPPGTLDSLLAQPNVDGGVLDALGRALSDLRVLGRIVVHRRTPNQTLNHIARTTNKTIILELLGRNQDRIATQPDLVEALYFNPNTPMRIAQSVFEFAVRQGLAIQHIPGYKEIVEGLLGKDFKVRGAAAPKRAPEPVVEVFEEEPTAPEAAAPTAGELDEGRTLEDLGDFGDFEDDEEEEEDEDIEDAFLRRLAQGEGFEEDEEEGLSEFDLLLRAAAEKGDENSEEEEDGPMGKSLHATIEEMEVPERIRMALVGNSNARKILIQDAMKLVSLSVLDNPGITAKEVALHAQNRALPDELVRKIGMNREWVRHYAVKLSLIQNPKTPPSLALNFLKFMRKNDLKTLSRSKDIPGIVMKMAKVQLDKLGG
ncbi:MAG: hypothetical protein ABIK09_17695 [Pseudomonadota bacterium]